jgi:hypothetical protein
VELWRDAAALILVFGLLAVGMAAARRRNGQSTGLFRPNAIRSLTALERISLTPQHSLHLVRASGRELLLATHPQGCTVISDSAQASALRRQEPA